MTESAIHETVQAPDLLRCEGVMLDRMEKELHHTQCSGRNLLISAAITIGHGFNQ